MLDKILENLLSAKQWIRIALMICFALVSWLVRLLQILIAIVQAICVLITGEENERLRNAGMVSSVYQAQIWLFLTYASDTRPFPMNDLPQDISDLDLNKEDVVFTYETTDDAQEEADDVFSDMSFTASEENKSKNIDEDEIPTLNETLNVDELDSSEKSESSESESDEEQGDLKKPE